MEQPRREAGMGTRIIAAALGAAAVWQGAAAAQDGRGFAADLSGGNTGISGHAQLAVHPRLALRMGYNWLDLGRDDEEISGVSYSGDLEFSGFGGFVDLHPTRSAFTVTGGVFVGDKSAILDAVPLEAVVLGDQAFQPDEVGTLTGEADFQDTAFFAGLGYDPSLYKDGRLSLIVRAGVMFAGEPDVVLDASRLDDADLPDAARAELRAALDEEAQIIADDIDDYAYFPVVTLGLGYRF